MYLSMSTSISPSIFLPISLFISPLNLYYILPHYITSPSTSLPLSLSMSLVISSPYLSLSPPISLSISPYISLCLSLSLPALLTHVTHKLSGVATSDDL